MTDAIKYAEANQSTFEIPLKQSVYWFCIKGVVCNMCPHAIFHTGENATKKERKEQMAVH